MNFCNKPMIYFNYEYIYIFFNARSKLVLWNKLILPLSDSGTSLEVIDLRTGATIGPKVATAAPKKIILIV